MRRTTQVWVLAAVLLGLVAAGCSDGPSATERAAAEIAASSATTVPATTAPSTTAGPGTTDARVTTPTQAPAGLGTGARGTEVAVVAGPRRRAGEPLIARAPGSLTQVVTKAFPCS